MKYKQYEIVLVNLDPTIGKEIKKTRPCVVVSPNEMNFNTLIVAPMTSQYRDFPTRIKINDKSYIALDQIRTISTGRVVRKLSTKLSQTIIKEIKTIFRIMLID